MKEVPDEWATRTREYHARLVPALRDKARELGYALSEHGSLRRDIDLLAVPWTVSAVSQDELAAALIEVIKQLNNGYAHVPDYINADPYDFTKRSPEPKPHGRKAWSIHLGTGPYIDLSVMPTINNPAERLHAELEQNVSEFKERVAAYWKSKETTGDHP